MLDKKDTTLIKLDCKSKDKVYDMLFGKADACLKNAKTVALLYLGSPYYMTRALEEYNIEEVNIFTTKDFKFIYEPFENAEKVKIWYVDNVKDTFKECDMKFDCIIMNPPYQRNLHLKILAEAIKHLKDDGTCVNLSPIPRLTSIRNLYDEKTITRNAKTEQYAYLKDVEQIRNGIEIFNAGIQQHLGIQVYSTNKHLIDIEQYVESDLPKDLVKKIMYKCMKYSLLNVEQHGDFELPISDVHGHIGSKDFLNIMALTYECQLSSVGRVKVKFLTENDRHAFYNFWMSSLGRLLTSLWKVDTNVEHRYIPYVWFKDVNEFAKWFDLTPAEQKIIEETMEKYK